MAIAGNKLLNLTGAKALYDDLRERVEAVDPTDIIDDTAGDGDTDKVWSADKVHDAIAGIDTSALAPKANPEFTGTITLGSTSMTEAQLAQLLGMTLAMGGSF